ncbi:MAG: DUF4398 domain-containing protein [Burkholderiales bacterium]|nr:DUF4398 domain-containing protein [Burkholderiales bacterium]ODU67243.1 MAG: hypothetical protein ABT05_04035 [Lautropia sp. SCN 66-9]
MTAANGWLMAGASIATLALAGCASAPPPVEQMAVSRSTIERVASSPEAVSTAPVELGMARDKLQRAEKAMTDKDYVLARRLAAEAEVDARVAESRASATRGERALAEVRASIRALQEELDRRSRGR